MLPTQQTSTEHLLCIHLLSILILSKLSKESLSEMDKIEGPKSTQQNSKKRFFAIKTFFWRFQSEVSLHKIVLR